MDRRTSSHENQGALFAPTSLAEHLFLSLKRVSFLAILLAFNCTATPSDVPFDWGLHFLRVKLSNGMGVVLAGMGAATDPENNYYVSGYFNSSARFGTNFLTSPFPCDAYLAKYDRHTNLLWVRQINNAMAPAVTATARGCVFIAGILKGDTMIGAVPVQCRGKEDAFLAKYDSAGNLLWFKQAGGADVDRADGVAVDSAGNSYITGQFRGEAVFGDRRLTPEGPCDFFIVKYDPNGKLLWAKRDAGGFTEARGIAVDVGGNIFATGIFHGTARFGSETVATPGGSDMFLVKYNTDGEFLWVRNPGGPPNRSGHNVAMDALGNPHVVGLIQGTQVFGTTNVSVIDPKHHGNVFLAKYTAAGDFQWVRQFRNGDFDFSNVVSIEASGAKLPPRLTEATKSPTWQKKTEALQAALHATNGAAQVSQPIHAPVLSFTTSGEFIVLFWSQNFANFILEASETLAPFPVWEVVTAKTENVDGQTAVAIPINSAMKFYRLRRP